MTRTRWQNRKQHGALEMKLHRFRQNARNRRYRARHEQQSGAGGCHREIDQRFHQSQITIVVIASDNPIPSNRFAQIRAIMASRAGDTNMKNIVAAAMIRPTRLDLERAGQRSATSRQTTPKRLANAGTDKCSAERHSSEINPSPNSGSAASHGAHQRRAGDRIGDMASGRMMEGQMPPQKMTAEAKKRKGTSSHMLVAPQDADWDHREADPRQYWKWRQPEPMSGPKHDDRQRGDDEGTHDNEDG